MSDCGTSPISSSVDEVMSDKGLPEIKVLEESYQGDVYSAATRKSSKANDLAPPQFGVVKEFSVVSKRLMGQNMQNQLASGNVQNLLMKSKSDARLDTMSEPEIDSFTTSGKDSIMRKSSVGGNMFGEGGYGDRSTSNWDWPFPTKPVVTSTNDTFQAEIDYTPFKANEIWVSSHSMPFQISIYQIF